MPTSYARRTTPGMLAFITPMLTIGMRRPVFPSVRVMTGAAGVAEAVCANSESKPLISRDAAIQARGLVMIPLRFHDPIFIVGSLDGVPLYQNWTTPGPSPILLQLA